MKKIRGVKFGLTLVLACFLLGCCVLSVEILSPSDGEIFMKGEVITFLSDWAGAAEDISFEWTSNIEGSIGTEDEVDAVLNVEGEHVITVTASCTTPPPEKSLSDTVRITIRDISGEITAPEDGEEFEEGEEIDFSGTSRDTIDGELTGDSLEWTSDIDGIIGEGTSFAAVLSGGEHEITLTATNSDGSNKDVDTITITIQSGMETNFYNNLTRGGRDFTARLECDDGVTVESDSGELSDCQPVSVYCNCRFYADGDPQGTFTGCPDLEDYCDDDATLILTVSGSTPALAYKCVDNCGDSITSTSDFLSDEDLSDVSLDTEVFQEPFELYLDY